MENTDSVNFKLETYEGKDGTVYTRLELGNYSVDWKHPLDYKTIATGMEMLTNKYTGSQDRAHENLIRISEWLLEDKLGEDN